MKILPISIILFFCFLQPLSAEKIIRVILWPVQNFGLTPECWSNPQCQLEESCNYECNTQPWLGRFQKQDKLLMKIGNLPTHTSYGFFGRANFFGQWEATEYLSIDVDGVTLLTIQQEPKPFICEEDPDLLIHFNNFGFDQIHSINEIQFGIQANLDQEINDESWAISRLFLLLRGVPDEFDPETLQLQCLTQEEESSETSVSSPETKTEIDTETKSESESESEVESESESEKSGKKPK